MTRKLPPFGWMGRDALEHLLATFDDEARSTALSIYAALSLLATRQHLGDQQAIQVSRRQLADTAGVSVRTLDSFTKRMERAGLLRVNRRRDGQLNLANTYSLLQPGSATIALGSATIAPPVVHPIAPHVAQPLPEGGATSDTRLKEERQEQQQEERTYLAKAEISHSLSGSGALAPVTAQPARDLGRVSESGHREPLTANQADELAVLRRRLTALDVAMDSPPVLERRRQLREAIQRLERGAA